MIRWLLLCGILISLPTFTDWLVDRHFREQHPDKNVGYTQQDRDGLNRLIEASHGKTVYVWRDHKAAQIASICNITPESLDSTVDILGKRRLP